MSNRVTVQFVNGGFIFTKVMDGVESVEVLTSTGKLNKAFRNAVDELSLLPKKADDKSEE